MPLAPQTILDALTGIAYVTDLEGRIICVGRRGWRLFAVDNGAVDLADADNFVGHNLFDFLAGEEVRTAYRRLLERLRLGEPQISLPCHCDAPGLVRDMRMTITALRQHRVLRGFLFQSITIAEHTRPPMRLFEFARPQNMESAPLIAMCSLCERVSPPEADCGDHAAPWLEAEQYYARGGSSHVRISHTVCPSCFRQWVQGWTGTSPPQF